MKNSLLKISLAALLMSFVSSAFAQNYFDKAETCLKVSDIKAIEGQFPQFKDFTNTNEDKVCRAEVGEKWFELVRSTLAMQRLVVTDDLQRDLDDDLTLRPIGDKDWWTYYTQRANQYVVEPARCNGNPNVVAFVYPFFRGMINLCPRFFELDSASQIEVLMHEVRHFDGHAHVTCTQGNEEGTPGACDGEIKRGGSYAVSVQANVELSYVSQLSDADRILAESGAIYSVNNKFNSLPTVKSTQYIYASNTEGEVWRMPEGDSVTKELVTTLKDPAKIYSNGTQFTVYPVDTAKDAYRISKDFTVEASAIGAFANKYNADADRKSYGPVVYLGIGSIVKDNALFAFCGEAAQALSSLSFTAGNVQALPTLKDQEGADKTVVLNDSGDVYDFNCDDKTGQMSTTLTRTTLPSDLEMGFELANKKTVVLTKAGELKSYDLNTNAYESELSSETNWLSATPLKVYDVFENASNN